ncbi:hypothetical protein OJF2_74970 [Aquisphaera giovannonii]|uniref:Uncharacterized protein n=1 Tax=Aquisphaera giovannonii TaxID=406548 RepID=A0A5B9WEC1_9BACT|nr:hypothetical protein OJF2_74970 [Aquisphaera giovannonii]
MRGGPHFSSMNCDEWLAAMDAIAPQEMTDAEIISWQAARHSRRGGEAPHVAAHADSLRGEWA